MASVFFGNRIDMVTAATPSTGSYLIAYDSDGVLKQKDEFGKIYPITLNITGGSGLTFSGNDLMVELDPNYLEFTDNKIKLKESIIGEIDFLSKIKFSNGLTSSDGYFTKLKVTDEPIIGADVINLDYFGLSFSELESNINNQISSLESDVIKSIISDPSLDIIGTSGTVSISISESSAGDGLSFSNSKYDVLLNTDGLSFDIDNNIKLNDIIIGDKQFIDSIIINGDLTVSGTTTYINTEQLEISDNIVTLNSGFTGSPFLDAGIKVDRGDEDYARIIWNEVSDVWTVGLSGSESEIITEAGEGLLKNINEVSLDYNIFGTGLSHSGGNIFSIPQSLSDTLSIGNTTDGNDIVLSGTDSITSPNGGLFTFNEGGTGDFYMDRDNGNFTRSWFWFTDNNGPDNWAEIGVNGTDTKDGILLLYNGDQTNGWSSNTSIELTNTKLSLYSKEDIEANSENDINFLADNNIILDAENVKITTLGSSTASTILAIDTSGNIVDGSSLLTSAQTLAQTLETGNETGGTPIVISNTDWIQDEGFNNTFSLNGDGTGQGNIFLGQNTGSVLYLYDKSIVLSLDNTSLYGTGVSYLYLGSDYTQLSRLANNGFYYGFNMYYNDSFNAYSNGISIKENIDFPLNSVNQDNFAVIVASKNSSISAGIYNSPIIGGNGLSATQSNTVYLGNNVNINNEYTLPNIDGNEGQVLTTDGNGEVTWQDTISIEPYEDIGTEDTTITWDLEESTNYKAVLTGNVTLDIVNAQNGMYGTIILQQDATGGREITLGAGTHRVVGGGAGIINLTSNPNAIDILSFTYDGSTFYWTFGNDYT